MTFTWLVAAVAAGTAAFLIVVVVVGKGTQQLCSLLLDLSFVL